MPDMELHISGSRVALRTLAARLRDACDSEEVDMTFHPDANCGPQTLSLTFDNDDMENRDDLPPDTLLWEIL